MKMNDFRFLPLSLGLILGRDAHALEAEEAFFRLPPDVAVQFFFLFKLPLVFLAAGSGESGRWSPVEEMSLDE